ncbi:conserved hypothetical protein [uncultured delta proteobacterium]|uniref:UDP-glucose 6-dehydrogenase n=1 Tax=uncultured delta proteobacterium TaxID=34034 RepID=A0A212KGY6_9DELT|nr:conserved hypothetical protein [uncultured delta proteobacterium]
MKLGNMTVCVQGLWHLGSVTAAALASLGFHVVGLDETPDTAALLAQGRAPVMEPGLDDLLRQGLDAGHLSFTISREVALAHADVLWVTYDTPVDEDDVADVDAVIASVLSSISCLRPGAVVLVSSQLPVGSISRLEEESFRIRQAKDVFFACSPENLRLGNALKVFLEPDRIIVGCRDISARNVLERLLSPISSQLEWMRTESAEMTKHAINAFLATSVVFANEIACLCEATGADAKEVERGLKTEQRIGPKAYLSPGAAFAGGTLARDIAFLGTVAQINQLQVPLLHSVKVSNDAHKSWVKIKLATLFPKLTGVHIAVWGLTYKAGTDTLRRSAAVELVEYLCGQGANVHVHDPAVPQLPANWGPLIQRHTDPISAVARAQVLVVGTAWPEYRNIAPEMVFSKNPNLAVIDADRFLLGWADKVSTYYAVGSTNQ